jgi:hypothetical protein
MQKLRSVHLYLGCIFAPLLLFFAISGIWQTLGIKTPLLRLMATIHTSHELKSGGGLSSFSLKVFVLIMTVSFIIMTILGVVMAVKYGRSRRVVFYSLIFGLAFPLILVLIHTLA